MKLSLNTLKLIQKRVYHHNYSKTAMNYEKLVIGGNALVD